MRLLHLISLAALAVVSFAAPSSFRRSAGSATPLGKLFHAFHSKIAGDIGKHNSPNEYYGYHEFLQSDIPTLILLLAGRGDVVKIPDVSTQYSFELCWPFPPYCSATDYVYDIKDTTIRHLNQTVFNVSMNGIRFTLKFEVPELHVDSPGYEYLTISHSSSTEEKLMDFDGYIKNTSLTFAGDLNLGAQGLQMSNIDFTIEVGKMPFIINTVLTRNSNGDWRQEEPIEGDLSAEFDEYWTDEEQENFKAVQEFWLNCFLSNGRVGGEECNEYLENRLHRQAFAQLIQAIGLGQLRKASV